MLRSTVSRAALCLCLMGTVGFAEETKDDHDAMAHKAGETHAHEAGDDHDDDHEHDDDHDHEHDHVHDRVFLDVDIAGLVVELAVEMPGGNLFPETLDKDARTLPAAATRFAEAGMGLAIPQEADCQQLTFTVDLHEIEKGDHAGHSQVTARQMLLCQRPEAFETLQITAFESFENIDDVILHAERDGYQVEADLAADAPVVQMAPMAAKP